MTEELELISDGEGVTVLGPSSAVSAYLAQAGIESKAVDLPKRFSRAASAGAGVTQIAAEATANSGRWVKLTEESAKALKLGQAMKGSADGLSRAIAVSDKGKITKVLEFAKSGSAKSILTNPATLTGVAGIMAQLAMQQSLEEITQYLAAIDEKVDDVLRNQKDAVLAEMIGVGAVIDEALLTRNAVGRVSEVTWSKLHGASQTIATVQAYAIKQLENLANKLESAQSVGKLADSSREAASQTNEWLAVLARSFQLQEALSVLELDRVLESSPDDLENHRKALLASRQHRRARFADTTERLLERIENASQQANEKVLLHPAKANRVIASGNTTGERVTAFQEALGIETTHTAITARKWSRAATDEVQEAGRTLTQGAQLVSRAANSAVTQMVRATNRLATRFEKSTPQQDPEPHSNEKSPDQ